LSNSLSPKWITDNLEEIISRLVNVTGPTFAELAGARYKIFSFLQGGRAVFRLEYILKLCHRLGLSVADFMTAMIGGLNCGIQVDETQLQSLKAPGRREADVRHVLEAALLEEPPPHLSEIAERLGYASTNHLHRKYEKMSRRIIAKCQMTDGGRQLTQQLPDKKQSYRLLRLLEQELSKADPRHPGVLAKKAGYKRASKAERQCPELWRALLDKHRKYKEEERRIERELIASALNEDPAPVMKEIVRRLGYRSTQTFRARFPEEYRAIREKRAQQKEKRLEEMEAKLRAALKEEPPRPLRQVAASLHRDRGELYQCSDELCRAIAARYIEYKKECARRKRLALKEQVHQIVLELHQRGLHPTRERVILLLRDPPMTSFVTLNEILREIREELNLPTL
jgi:AraC-like DNA-binding protein